MILYLNLETVEDASGMIERMKDIAKSHQGFSLYGTDAVISVLDGSRLPFPLERVAYVGDGAQLLQDVISSFPDDLVLKVNRVDALESDFVNELIEFHKGNDKPVTFFCPGVNDLFYSSQVVLEAIDVGRIRLLASKSQMRSQAANADEKESDVVDGWSRLESLLANLLRPVLPRPLTRWLNTQYFKLKGALTARISPQPALPETKQAASEEESDFYGFAGTNFSPNYIDLPPSEIKVFRGKTKAQIHFLADRVDDFFPFPKVVMLVLTNRCNLKCVMCPYHSPKYVPNRKSDFFDRAKKMDIDLVEKIAAEVGRFKANIHIGELGEPAMHPNLPEIVGMLSEAGANNVHITTNGQLFDEELSEKVIRAGLGSISFSIDAMTPETYREIRGGDFNRVQDNVLNFIRLRNRLNPGLTIYACMILQGNAIKEKDEFIDYWRQQGVNTVSIYQLFDFDEHFGSFVASDRFRQHDYRTPCSALWDQCFVFPEGEVSLCCRTLGLVPESGVVSMGNVYKQPLSEIWKGPEYTGVRKGLIEALATGNFEPIPYCERCETWASMYPRRKKLDDGTIYQYNEQESFYIFPDVPILTQSTSEG